MERGREPILATCEMTSYLESTNTQEIDSIEQESLHHQKQRRIPKEDIDALCEKRTFLCCFDSLDPWIPKNRPRSRPGMATKE